MTLFNTSYRDQYASKLGVPLTVRPKHDPKDVQRMLDEVKRQHPDHSHDEALGRALARLDAHFHQRQSARMFIVTKQHNWRRWAEIATIVVLLLAVIGLSAKLAHGQVDGVKIQKDGTTVGGPCMGGICGVNFSGSGCTVSKLAQVWTVTCTSGSVTNNPGGTANQLQTNNGAGAFGAIPSVGLGKVLIDQGSGNAPAFADPLVQGLYAAGTTTIPNPVITGGSDYGGTPTLRLTKVDSSGNMYAVVTFASPQHVIVDSATLGTVQVQSNSANIATETTLAGIKTGTDKIPAQGQALSAASLPVVLPATQITTLTPPAAITNYANETGGNLAAIKTDVDKIPAQGQALAAASMPVVLPAAQITTLTPPAAITNFANETGGNLATVKTNTDVLGAKTDAKATQTDATSVTIMQVLKEISAMVQAPATTPASQSGTWTVQPGNTANTTAWKVDGSAVNQPAIGTLADNGAAAATNRIGTLPSVTQTSYENGTASTQGRNAALSTGTDGLLWTANLPAIRPASYTATAAIAASSTTDNCRMPGNASNTVLVTMVKVSGTQTTAGSVTVTINKRSTAGSGGTAANMTVVPDDSNYAAGVSVPQSYTGTGPTVGTLVGAIDNMKVGFLATSTASPQDIYILNLRQKPIVLRGTAENLTVNLGGAVTGGNMTCTFNWIETATITP